MTPAYVPACENHACMAGIACWRLNAAATLAASLGALDDDVKPVSCADRVQRKATIASETSNETRLNVRTFGSSASAVSALIVS